VRILVVTNDLPPRVGGIQYYVDQLCRGLVAAGDQVVVHASSSPGWEAFDADAPYEVVREPTSVLLPTPTTLRHATTLARRTDADVVLFGAAFPLGLLGPLLLRRCDVPYVGFTHGLEVSAARAPATRRLLRLVGREAGAVTFVSEWCEEELRPSFGPGPRYELLPPAVDPRDFHPGVDGTAVRARHGLGEDPVVVCVSRMVERKGQDQLVRALPELRRRVGGTRLLLVGDGPYRGALEALAREHGVADAVTFSGEVSDAELPAHFAAGDVFAMPCRERRGGLEVEAFGIVFLQAQAVGRPVVAGNIGGVPDAVADGGTLVDGEDLAAVTAAVGDLLADPQRAAAIGAAAARRVAATATWDRRTERLRELLAAVTRSA
jgi:phosphatidylinositol alpha-1,6-mannosyltransferase